MTSRKRWCPAPACARVGQQLEGAFPPGTGLAPPGRRRRDLWPPALTWVSPTPAGRGGRGAKLGKGWALGRSFIHPFIHSFLEVRIKIRATSLFKTTYHVPGSFQCSGYRLARETDKMQGRKQYSQWDTCPGHTQGRDPLTLGLGPFRYLVIDPLTLSVLPCAALIKFVSPTYTDS